MLRKGSMPKKVYEIEEVKKERRGFLQEEKRVTSRDSAGKVAVGDWKSTTSEAQRSSRERLSEPPKKK